MVINQKNNIKENQILYSFVRLVNHFYSCNTEAGPVSGCYKIKTKKNML